MIAWTRSPKTRSDSGIAAIAASTALSPSALSLFARASAFNSLARSFIAARSSAVNPRDVLPIASGLLVVLLPWFIRFSFWGRLRRPGGRFNPKLLGVLRVQPLPTAELHRVTADDAADGSPAQKPIQNIETDVPPGSTHRDEATIDIVPQRQARADTQGLELPSHIVILKHSGSVGAR